MKNLKIFFLVFVLVFSLACLPSCKKTAENTPDPIAEDPWPLHFSDIIKLGFSDVRGFDMVIDTQNRLHIFYCRENFDLYHTISSDGGNNWSDPHRLKNMNGWPAVTVDSSDHLYLVWVENGNKMYFVRTTDSGTTWTTPVKILTAGDALGAVHISATGNGTIVTAWQAWTPGEEQWSEVYAASSADNGNTWLTAPKIGDGRLYGMTQDKNGNGYLVWDYLGTNSTGGIYFSRSSNMGAVWSSPSRLMDGINPVIGMSENGFLSIIYYNINIENINSSDSGENWSQAVTIQPGHNSPPVMEIDRNDYLNAAWYYGTRFHCSRSTDNGRSWLPSVVSPELQVAPSGVGMRMVSDSNDNLYLVWHSENNSDCGDLYLMVGSL